MQGRIIDGSFFPESNFFCVENLNNISKEEWEENRKNYIGGSDCYSLVYDIFNEKKPWDTPYTLYIKKTMGISFKKFNSHMERGVKREPEILNELRSMGKDVYRVPYLIKSKNKSFMCANIDAVMHDGKDYIGVEIKSTSSLYNFKNGVPKNYWTQCQYYMSILGDNRWILVADCEGEKLFFEIKRDDDFIKELLNRVNDFWENNVLKSILPEPIFLDTEKEYINYMNREHNDLYIDLNEYTGLAKEYFSLLEMEKTIKEQKDLINSKVKYLIGNNRGANFNGYRTILTRYKKPHFDIENFKKENPELFEKYCYDKDYSVLKFYKEKE